MNAETRAWYEARWPRVWKVGDLGTIADLDPGTLFRPTTVGFGGVFVKLGVPVEEAGRAFQAWDLATGALTHPRPIGARNYGDDIEFIIVALPPVFLRSLKGEMRAVVFSRPRSREAGAVLQFEAERSELPVFLRPLR